jgi:hypothetical protein
MVETIIRWSLNNIFKADPTKCYEEICEIGDEVKPEQVLAKAKNEDSELHKCFDWNDTSAAEKYRLFQAKQVINHLIVIKRDVEEPEKEPVQFRVMLKNEKSYDSGYKQTIVMVRDEDEYRKMLEQAYAELKAFKKKYACLSELSDILAMIE